MHGEANSSKDCITHQSFQTCHLNETIKYDHQDKSFVGFDSFLTKIDNQPKF
jgi:hypothetical protein